MTSKADRDHACGRLREVFKPGDKVWTILRHVSASGMSREISFIQVQANGEVRQWDILIGDALGLKAGKHGGLKVSGCGSDMGFMTVYDLGHALFPKVKPSDEDPGYSLKHGWL